MNFALTQGFSNFLRRRRAKKHFERRPLLGSLTASSPTPATGGKGVAALGNELLAAAQEAPAQALQRLK